MYSTSHPKVLLIIRVGQYAAGITPFRQYLNAYQFSGGQEIIICVNINIFGLGGGQEATICAGIKVNIWKRSYLLE